MKDFTLPANIKQIGSIGNGLRIYLEDYVCTFLHQYAASGGYEERIAYLVGRHMVIDGQQFLFISGAIYGMYTEQMEGYIRFTQKSADYAEAMLDEHFPGQEIVGWMQSQPSYGTYLNHYYSAYHMRQFLKPYNVLFVMDPLERVNTFYSINSNAITPSDRMAEVGGYFIYYEKNVNMHEYMLTNKSVDYADKPPTFVEMTQVDPDDAYEHAHPFEDETNERDTLFAMHDRYEHEPEEIIRRHQASTAQRRVARVEQRRASNLVGGLCAVLFIVSFVMGVGLIRNQDRIDRLEGELRQLTTAHRNLFTQLSNPELALAFAEASPTTTMPMPAQTTAPPETTTVIPTTIPTTTEPPPTQPPATTLPEHTVLVPSIPATYTIQPGDSLLAISIYFFGDAGMVGEILALNGIENADHIVAGRTIALPRR